MPTVYGTQSNDFDHGNVLRTSYPIATTGEQVWGPFRLPTFGEQSADIVCLTVTSSADMDLNLSLESAADPSDGFVPVGDTKAVTEKADGVRAVYVCGDWIQAKIDFTTASTAVVNVVLMAKTR